MGKIDVHYLAELALVGRLSAAERQAILSGRVDPARYLSPGDLHRLTFGARGVNTGCEAAPREQSGEVHVSGQDAVFIQFDQRFLTRHYQVSIVLGTDTSVGGGPGYTLSQKTEKGIGLAFDAPYTGTVSWSAWVRRP